VYNEKRATRFCDGAAPSEPSVSKANFTAAKANDIFGRYASNVTCSRALSSFVYIYTVHGYTRFSSSVGFP